MAYIAEGLGNMLDGWSYEVPEEKWIIVQLPFHNCSCTNPQIQWSSPSISKFTCQWIWQCRWVAILFLVNLASIYTVGQCLMALDFCSASRVSFKTTLPALNGGCTWKNGNFPALCQWNKKHPGHGIQVMILFESFMSCFSNLYTWLYPACSHWLQKDEEIMMDIATCAMAFRLLRMNGYDVSSGTTQLTYLEFPTALVLSLILT